MVTGTRSKGTDGPRVTRPSGACHSTWKSPARTIATVPPVVAVQVSCAAKAWFEKPRTRRSRFFAVMAPCTIASVSTRPDAGSKRISGTESPRAAALTSHPGIVR